MKTRNLLAAACMTALAMVATGCSNDLPVDNTTPDNPQPEMGITEITAAMPAEGPSTRLVYEEGTSSSDPLSVKWEEAGYGNGFYAFNVANGTWNGSKFKRKDRNGVSEIATFKNYGINDQTAVSLQNGYLLALYPAKDAYKDNFLNPTAGNVQEIPLPLTGQDGRTDYMQNFHYMTAETAISGGSTPTLQFAHRVAILRLEGLTFDNYYGNVRDLTISGTGLRGGAKLRIEKNADNTITTSIVLDDTDAALTLTEACYADKFNNNKLTTNEFLCFFPNPAGITDLKITAKGTLNDGTTQNFEFVYTGAVGTVAEPFKPGHMYTLSNATMTAAASGISGYFYYKDGTQSATLDTSGSKECIGVVVDDAGTLVVSNELGEDKWSAMNMVTNATNAEDGSANVQTIRNSNFFDFSYYPALTMCYNAPSPSGKTWYLPSINELKLIIANKDKINPKLQEAGFSTIADDGKFWSSTEVDQTQAKAIDSGTEVTRTKNSSFKVRGVIKIN